MQIWVDADACPQAIKEILFRAAECGWRDAPGGALIDGPAPFGQRERQLFANHLDRFLTRHRHA